MFLLHIPCWLHFYLASFSYTFRAGFNFIWGVTLKHAILDLHLCVEFLLYNPMVASFFSFFLIWGVSLTHPVLASFLCGEFLLNIPCSRDFYVGSFSYTSHVDFVFMCEFSLTHPMLPSFLCGEFLLHIPCCLDFHAKSHTGFIFIVGVSLTLLLRSYH